MIKLFLDDVRYPDQVFRGLIGGDSKFTLDPLYEENSSWVIVRTYNDFVSFIRENDLPDLVSFDHDLTFEHYKEENQRYIDYKKMDELTGYHAAEWLIAFCKENQLNFPEYRVHSMNPEGNKNIDELIQNFKNKQI
jgi:hypothetical protein